MSSEALGIAYYLHRSTPDLARTMVRWPRGVTQAPPDETDRLPTRDLAALLESLERAGGSALAARAGVDAGLRPATALPLLLRSSASVEAQIERAVAYWRVLSSSTLERRSVGDSVELVIVDEWRDRTRGHDHYAAFLVGLLVGALRHAQVTPEAVALPGSGPGSLNGSSYAVFGVHASSGSDLPRVRVAAWDLLAAPRGADGDVATFLGAHLGRTLERLQMAISWQVDELLRDHLADGMGMRGAAKLLGLSERTLRRRLDEEGTSFRERLDGVRRARALELLTHEDVDPVARALGFVDARSFQRAFRRWTRMTPLAYQRSLREGPALHA
ncbi:MAG: helix-turn-helix domain-containing protein [Sandaracinaceae bacterium]|nr:helix-turn-helix domain-containing protein [Sandaracinaceae bacterium]